MPYKWPGNVRELENIIERAVVLSRGRKIDESHLPQELIDVEEQPELPLEFEENDLERSVANLETMMIINALKNAQGNKSKAARSLNISERTLWYKFKKYHIDATRIEE